MLIKSLCRCVYQGPEFLSLPERVAPGPEAAEPAHQQERGAQAGRLWAGARIRHTCQVRGQKAGVWDRSRDGSHQGCGSGLDPD